MVKHILKCVLFYATLWLFPTFPESRADIYALPPSDLDMIGTIGRAHIRKQETLVALTRRLGFGQQEIQHANPEVDRWIPDAGQPVILPSRYLLPESLRSGIVINIPEMRLYYFHPIVRLSTAIVETFPISIGQLDWSTPIGASYIIRKKENPNWYPPASIKAEAASVGHLLPDKVPAGPSNPLGQHALYLNIPGYLMHGTNAPNGIGLQVTHGCIRLYPQDIRTLHQRVAVGTNVMLVNQPVKVGWHADALYIEVHPPVLDPLLSTDQLIDIAIKLIKRENEGTGYTWLSSQVRRIVMRQNGIPTQIKRTQPRKPTGGTHP